MLKRKQLPELQTGTIENNDDRTIAINSVQITEEGGPSNPAVLDVIISPEPDSTSGPITVTYTLSDTASSTDPA